MRLPTIQQGIGGELTIYRHRNGKREFICRKKNLVLNSQMSFAAGSNMAGGIFYAFTDGAANYEDLDGTWNQTGNTVTRATGTGTFPNSPSQLGNELQWEDGERCHVTARASDTSITVSGPARTLTGKTIRRWLTNRTSISGSAQSKASTSSGISQNHATGVSSVTFSTLFDSATVAYTLRSVMVGSNARVVVPDLAVDVDDQLEMSYTVTHTNGNRTFAYELGAEATGIPRKYAITGIVGSGSNVDITFAAATPFLAGDKLDLRGVVPKRFAISSASSDATTLTINTTAAHGLSVSDSVVIEGASLGGYNGTFTVASVPDADTITITDSANPGAMGASGTVRLANPGTYFDDLGLATIASMVSSSVARITSAITGPAVDLQPIGSTPEVRYDVWGGASYGGRIGVDAGMAYFSEANAKAIPVPSTTGNISSTGQVARSSSGTVNATYVNDFTHSNFATWNAGFGESRIKQIIWGQVQSNCNGAILTFDTPQNKTSSDRLQASASIQLLRELVP